MTPDEALSWTIYRLRIAHQRDLGLAYVGRELDRLCRELGLDPEVTWRTPAATRRQWNRDLAAWRAGRHMASTIPTPKPPALTIGGSPA